MNAGPVDGRTSPAETEVRSIGDGDAIPVSVLRDLVQICLRHDALGDVTMERLDRLAKEGALDVATVTRMAPALMGEILGVVGHEDWLHVSGALIDAYRDAADRERATEAIRLLGILRDREDDPGGKGYLIGAIEATRAGDPVPEEWLKGLRRAVEKGDAS
jgi:hypothetical protein